MKKILLVLFCVTFGSFSARAGVKITKVGFCTKLEDIQAIGICSADAKFCEKAEKGGLAIQIKGVAKAFRYTDPNLISKILLLLKINSSLPKPERMKVCLDGNKGEKFQLRD